MKNKKNTKYDLFKKYGDIKQIQTGEKLFTYNKRAKRLYLILSGKINIFIKTKNNKEKQIDQLNSGDLLGEASMLEKINHSSKAIAEEKSNLLVFSPQDFKILMTKQPDLTEKIVKNLSKRIQKLQKPPKKNTKNNDKFYLKGHTSYSETADTSFQDYLYTKEIECPVCSTNLKVKKIRNSRLHLAKMRDDLRPIYKDFKPHWYKIWSCPNCFYTAPQKDFFDVNKKHQKQIANNFKKNIKNILGKNYTPGFSEPRNLNEVFNSYYLAINLYNLINPTKDKYSYLWLRLSWLYEDINENKLATKASYKAMENLRDFYYNDRSSDFSNSQNNKLKLLLSILFYKHGLEDEAIPLLNDLVHESETKAIHRKKAKNLFIKIRDKQRNENKD